MFFTGAVLGMALPALLYVTFLPRGTDIRGLGISAALAHGVGARAGPLLAGAIAFLGAWILVKTQLDNVEGMTRAITDILWTGSRRIRAWRGGDVRAVYYAVLSGIVLWGIIALRLAQPIILLQLGANVAGVVLIVSSLHLLYVNTRLLPVELRPPAWRRVALVAMALFYGFFVGPVAEQSALACRRPTLQVAKIRQRSRAAPPAWSGYMLVIYRKMRTAGVEPAPLAGQDPKF